MEPKDAITVNLKVDWRVLVVLGAAICILVLASFAVSAQGGDPPTTNDVQIGITANTPAQPSVALPGPLELNCTDGLLPSTNGECVPTDAVESASSSPVDAASVTAIGGGGRHFYLTNANYATSAALTACASGYHMASLWEILDVSNLAYDYAHPAAHTKADSGYGPPSSWNGWVRTGYFSSNVNVTGTGNCNNWSSVANTDYGVSVKLANAWETAPGDISTWDGTSFTCNFIGPVWCVGN